MSKDWKQALLSSGFPLEYEVTNMLLNSDFHVEGEQPYTRRTQTGDEEFSVDLCANHFVPKPDEAGSFKGQLVVLCECKYRAPNKAWLFMPDLNEVDFAPTSPVALRDFPAFTTFSYDFNPVIEFCVNPPRAMKGVEVQTNGGEAFDKDIRHAFNQLRYAMPDLILRHVYPLAFAHPDDCKPFFVLPVVVTSSPLRLLKRGVDLDSIIAAQNLEDISDEVNLVDVHSPYAEDFRQHCARVFSNLTPGKFFAAGKHRTFQRLETYHEVRGSSRIPLEDVESLKNGNGLDPGFFSQFPVVNLKALPNLLSEAKRCVESALRESKQLVFAEKAKA